MNVVKDALIVRTTSPNWDVEFIVPEEKIVFWREEYLARLGGK